MDLEDSIEKYALKNAVEHKGIAQAGAVFSKLVTEHPDVRENIEFTMKLIEEKVKEINKMGISSQKIRLLKIDSHALDKKETQKKELTLPNVKGKVTMRYAPNPNAGMHIGNARVAILNDYFVKKYGGTFILRFDDTDPKNESKKPAKGAYNQIRDDLQFLGIEIHKESYASRRLDMYYEYFEELLRKGKAYICTCEAEDWQERRKAGIACNCRMNSIYENKRKWVMMLKHDFEEGQAVARIKTDMKYKDPAQRDWVAFRIINKPEHAVTKNQYTVWPMLDFASAIDDYELNVTHILRGQDLKISELRQKWIYDYFSWAYPTTLTIGHMGFEGAGKISKSEIKTGIDAGKYSGWDDPQLPMIASYKRRGFNPESIRKLIMDTGLTGGKISVSEEMLASNNKELIDFTTPRYHFVKKPKKVKIEGLTNNETTIPKHPTNTELGERKVKLTSVFYIDPDDFEKIQKTKKTRLIDIGNVVKKSDNTLEIKGTQEVDHEMPKIHWVNYKGLKCEILMPNDRNIAGLVEEDAAKEKIGTVMQFVRFGFVKLDKKMPLTFVFAHR